MTDFNWPVLIWPMALTVFVVFFFWAYHKDVNPLSDVNRKKKKRITRPERPKLSLSGRPGNMTRQDWLAALALTLVYGVFAFSFAGDTVAPQTFWRATEENPSLMLDLGETVQLDNLIYYPGLILYTDVGEAYWKLEFSADGREWREQPFMPQADFELFMWKIPLLEPEQTLPVRYLRLTADTVAADYMELGELALTIRGKEGRALLETASLIEKYPQYAALFDEQSLVPELPDLSNRAIFDRSLALGMSPGRVSDRHNSMIFDEVYHARTGYEYVRNVVPDEDTHPPLGKLIIALGIRIFGLTPFGWRFMGILFGALMLPLLYMFIKNLFDNTTVAVCGIALFAFENMHFAQTQLATIDTYVVFFILAMYLFMYRYISSGYDATFSETLPPLLLCGLSFGLGAASKWTGFFAALGLVVLYTVYLVKRGQYQIAAGQKKEFRSFLLRTLAASTVCFVVIPVAIYTLSYIPNVRALGLPLTPGNLVGEMWNNSVFMLEYHGSSMLGEVHEYESRWWMWILDIQPIRYFSRSPDGSRTIVAAFTNPLVTVGGLAAMGFALSDFLRKRVKESLVIMAGYLAQLVPWIFIARNTFAYHYFPAMIFLTLAICYVFKNILQHRPERKRRIYLFTGVSVGLFFLLLPPVAGIPMPDWYFVWFARWLPSWPF